MGEKKRIRNMEEICRRQWDLSAHAIKVFNDPDSCKAHHPRNGSKRR